MSADIICLLIDPSFIRKSYTQCPRFSPLQTTPNDLHFSKFHCKIQNFSRASATFRKFCQCSSKIGKFSLKFNKISPKDPYFGKLTCTKKGIWGGSHTHDPLFYYEILRRMPSSRHIPVTSTSAAPPPGYNSKRIVLKAKQVVLFKYIRPILLTTDINHISKLF